MDIKVVYILIVVLVGLAIAVSIFSGGMSARAKFEQQAGLITRPGLVSVKAPLPTVDAVGTKDCLGTLPYNCTYRPNINGLLLETANATDKLAIVVSYKGRSAIVPCRPTGPWGAGIPSGPCRIDKSVSGKYQAAFDLKPVFSGVVSGGFIPDIPPAINASPATALSKVWLYDGQRIILGNYSIDLTIRSNDLLKLQWFLKKAEVAISCRDETKIIDFNVREPQSITLCGKEVRIVMPLETSTSYACFNISTEHVAGSVGGEPVLISFWIYDDQFRFSRCGGMASEPPMQYFEQMPFDVGAAFGVPACSERFLGGYQLYAPVAPMDGAPQGTWKPDTC